MGPHVGTVWWETPVVLPAERPRGRTTGGDVALTRFLGVEILTPFANTLTLPTRICNRGKLFFCLNVI
jgi:hypothetical protein